VERDLRKEARPGVSDAVAGAILGLNFAKVLFGKRYSVYKMAGNLATIEDQEGAGYNSLPSSVVQCCLGDSVKSVCREFRRVPDILCSTDHNSRKKG
jgi:hypothetical protein